MTTLRLTDAGRAAAADAANRALANVQLRAIAIGDGTGPGGAADDARVALRSERARSALTGSSAVAGRVVVRGEFTPAAAYAVTEAGIIARVGDRGAEFLFAYLAAPEAAQAVAAVVAGNRLVLAGVIDVAAGTGRVEAAVDATINVQRPGTLAELTDVGAFSGSRYLRANAAGRAAGWDQAPPVVATEAGLPAPGAAVQATVLVSSYAASGHPAIALAAGGRWRFAWVRDAFPENSAAAPSLVELATPEEHVAAVAPADRAATPAGVRADVARLLAELPRSRLTRFETSRETTYTVQRSTQVPVSRETTYTVQRSTQVPVSRATTYTVQRSTQVPVSRETTYTVWRITVFDTTRVTSRRTWNATIDTPGAAPRLTWWDTRWRTIRPTNRATLHEVTRTTSYESSRLTTVDRARTTSYESSRLTTVEVTRTTRFITSRLTEVE